MRHLPLSLALPIAMITIACHVPDDPDSMSLEASSGAQDDEDPDAAPPSWRALVDHAKWRDQLSAAEDPWPEHRPPEVDCEAGWTPEADGIEIDTGACNYLALQQPLPVAIATGDPIRLRMWWQSLASVEPAEGHVAVLVDGERLWDEHVPIPGPAAARSLEFESPLSAPAGATLTLHLHNHGYNTWHFHELSVLSPDEPPCETTHCD